MNRQESTPNAQSPTTDDEQHVLVSSLVQVRNVTATFLLLSVLYVGSYFATAFAAGAGWMSVETRHRIVWTVHRPISKCAVSKSAWGSKYINDANGWFFTAGWQNLHE